MRLHKWLETNNRRDVDKKQYVNCVDIILVQLCKYVKNCLDNSKRILKRFTLEDFDFTANMELIPNCQEKFGTGIASGFREYGLLELFLQLLIPNLSPEKMDEATWLDLPAELQEFDTIIEILESNSICDFWDFPVAIAKVDFVDEISGETVKSEKILIENIDEVYVLPDSMMVAGERYRVLVKLQIGYSFLRRSYRVSVKKMPPTQYSHLEEYDLGIIAYDEDNYLIFIPLKKTGKNTLEETLTILPQPYQPYITVSLAFRNKSYSSARLERDNPSLYRISDINLHLAKQNVPKVRQVSVTVPQTHMCGSMILVTITVTESTSIETRKEVEIQL